MLLTRIRLVCWLLVAAATPLIAIPSHAQTVPDGAERITSVEGITEYRLENGMRVLLFPDPSQPRTVVNVTYLVGSRHEGYGETGMAHLLEHLLFKGTPDHPDIPKELSERGAQPNGTTSVDRTNYYEVFPASDENLAWALDMEADRMVNSFVSADDLDSEMTVVRNEMEAGENNPIGILLERVFSTAYLWHNYGKSTIGSRADVESVPIERLRSFYRKYYQPDNAVLVVAGDFDEELALELVVEEFGSIPRPDRSGDDILWPTYTREPTQDGERAVTLRRVGEVPVAVSMYHVPPGSHEDFAAIDILRFVLGDSPSGRLYQAMVESGEATQATAFARQLAEAAPFVTLAMLSPDGDVDAALELMNETVEGVLMNPITGDEVERAKASITNGIQQAFNNSVAIALGLSEWTARGDWRLFFLHRDRIEAVTADDVNRVAHAYLKPSNRTVGRFIPTDAPDRAEIPSVPDVASLVDGYTGREAVAAGEAFDPSPSNIDARTTTFTLSNGMEVAFLSKETRGDQATIHLRLHFGDEESLRGRGTAGGVAAGMLMRGTEVRDREAIQDELDRLNAQGSLGGGPTQAAGQFQTVRTSVAAVIGLMGELARRPSFPEEEFEIIREQQIAGLEQASTDPQALAEIELARIMEPHERGHPNYNETIEEAIESLRSVTLDDARSFYADFWGPQNGKIAVVGDFDEAEARAAIEEAFGDWESPHPFARIAGAFVDPEAQNVEIETPDKPNAILWARQNFELRDTDADYAALLMAGEMIGGGVLNSRLADRIRDEEGLSYAVQAIITGHPVDGTGQLLAVAIFAPENVDKVESALIEELQKVLDTGFSQEELDGARQGWLEGRQLSRSQDSALAGALAQNLYFDRTFDFAQALEDRVRSLSLEEVNQAIRDRLDLDKLTIVKGGDFANKRELIG